MTERTKPEGMSDADLIDAHNTVVDFIDYLGETDQGEIMVLRGQWLPVWVCQCELWRSKGALTRHRNQAHKSPKEKIEAIREKLK